MLLPQQMTAEKMMLSARLIDDMQQLTANLEESSFALSVLVDASVTAFPLTMELHKLKLENKSA